MAQTSHEVRLHARGVNSISFGHLKFLSRAVGKGTILNKASIYLLLFGAGPLAPALCDDLNLTGPQEQKEELGSDKCYKLRI
jgi:hypothetical protein